MTLYNKIQIISYPDSLGKNLQKLHYVLTRYFAKAAGGFHILPFYPSSADREYSPITYNASGCDFKQKIQRKTRYEF